MNPFPEFQGNSGGALSEREWTVFWGGTWDTHAKLRIQWIKTCTQKIEKLQIGKVTGCGEASRPKSRKKEISKLSGSVLPRGRETPTDETVEEGITRHRRGGPKRCREIGVRNQKSLWGRGQSGSPLHSSEMLADETFAHCNFKNRGVSPFNAGGWFFLASDSLLVLSTCLGYARGAAGK